VALCEAGVFISPFYSAGFQSWIGQRLHIPAGFHPATSKLAYAGITLLASATAWFSWSRRIRWRLRWLSEQVRSGRHYQAFLALDSWIVELCRHHRDRLAIGGDLGGERQ